MLTAHDLPRFTVGDEGLVVDLSCFPRHKKVQIFRRKQSTGPLLVDFGPFTEPRCVEVGSYINILRRNRFDFKILEGPETWRPVKPPTTDKRLLIVGQSLGSKWAWNPAARAFCETRQRLGYDATWLFINLAVQGSAALREFAPTDKNNWWLDLDTGEHGPVMKRCLDHLAKLRAGDLPTHILWSQGQTDSLVYSVKGAEYGDVEFRERFRAATLKILETIRSAIAPSDPYSVPVYIQTIGAWTTGARHADPIVLDVEHAIIEEFGEERNLHLGPVQPMDLPLADSVHPSASGFSILGYLLAKAV